MINTAIAVGLPFGQLTLAQRAINILKSAGPGAWYDPSDIANYMASVGPELVTNGDFSGGTTGWIVPAAWDVSSGVASTTNSSASLVSVGTTTPGKFYRVEFDLTYTSGALFVAVGGNYAGATWFTSSGRKSIALVSGSESSHSVEFYGGAFTGSIDNISAKELTGLSACTMFQDSAGTTPVTAVEQPVGLILDKSGGGNHAIQPTATSRPILRQDGNGMYHLAFDGIDDSLYSAASVDFTSTDKMTVFAGVHKASDAATAALVELSADALSTNGAFVLGAPFGTGTATYDQYVRGTAVSGVAIGSTPAPTTNVITAVGDIAGDLNRVTKNGTTSNQIGGDLGTGNFGNYPLYVGRRNNASLPFNGRIYQLAIKGKAMTAAEISTLESYINSKTKAF